MRDKLDEIKFGERKFTTTLNDRDYIVYTSGGSFFGNAHMIDNICMRFDIVYSKGSFSYKVKENDEFVDFTTNISDMETYENITKVLDNRMWQHLERTEVEGVKWEVA